MLIHLEATADAVLAAGPSGERVLSEILRSHREGHHLVIIRREVASELIARVDLNSQERAILAKIRAEFTQTSDLLRRATTYLEVTDVDTTPSKYGNKIGIGFHALLQSRILERPKLVVENLESDGQMLGYIFNNISDLLDVPPPSYDDCHGGGDDLPKVFRKHIELKHIVCAIVDSDRKSPFDAPSHKTLALKQIVDSHAWPFCFASELPCHEVENLLPLETFRKIPNMKVGHLDLLQKITDKEHMLNHRSEPNFWLYFDIKLGLDPRSLNETWSEETRSWLTSKLKLLGTSPIQSTIPGHGSKLIERAFSNNACTSAIRQAIRSKEWQVVFSGFFLHFMWIFACASRQRV